ncbi:MAG: hypothetical protein AAFQ37_14725, partial [Bacteroidota bacterium]
GNFFCTCRSRLRPCTHALSLVMILNNQQERFTVGQRPEWVEQLKHGWLQKNTAPAEVSPPPSSEDRLSKRRQLMEDGIAELELRLVDIFERGLADTNTQGQGFWFDMAARLTDAKLGGLANRVRTLANAELEAKEQIRLLGDLYLAVRSWQNEGKLNEKQRVELYQVLGVNVKKEEVLARPGKNDHWLVMGTVEGVEDRLRYRRVWLRGEKIKRYALLLDFAFGEQAFERSWPLASSWQGEISYYPGSYPQRGIFPRPRPGGRPYDGLKGYNDYAEMLYDYQRALALNPWLNYYPVYLADVRPWRRGKAFFLLDGADRPYLLPKTYTNFYTLLAASGGNPISVFAEFDGACLRPLSFFNRAGLIGV